MSIVKAEAETVFLQDYNTNSDKFYRTYVVGEYAVFQWGRRGTRGQFKLEKHDTNVRASQAANKKLNEKKREGYGGDIATIFDFDPAFLAVGKAACVQLDDVRQAAEPLMAVGVSTAAPAPAASAVSTPVAAARDPYGEFTARALAAIALAVTDPIKGATEYAILNAAWPELEEMHAKAQSYLNTLDSLVIGGTT